MIKDLQLGLVHAGFGRTQALRLARAVHGPGRGRLAIVDRAIEIVATGQAYTFDFGRANQVFIDPDQAMSLCYTLAISDDVGIRRRLATKLGVIDSTKRVPLFCRLLHDPDDRIKRIAFTSLDEVSPHITKALADSGVIRLDDDRGRIVHSGPRPRLEPATDIVAVQHEGPPSQPPGAGSSPPPPGAPAPPPSAPETIRRFTDLEFTPDRETPAAGDLVFTLKVQAHSSTSVAVDVRVPPGRDRATLLVFAGSSQLTVGPTVRVIGVPRSSDSERASFRLTAGTAGSAEVTLLVYDEYRLIGSVLVRFEVSESPTGLALTMIGPEVFREAGTAPGRQRYGYTLQVSFDTRDGLRVAYHALTPPNREGAASELRPMGVSPARYESRTIPDSLASLRVQIDEVEKGLADPVAMLGAADKTEALEDLGMILQGAGKQLGEDMLSPEVRGYLWALPAGSPVNWVVGDQSLDAVPWELARDPFTNEAVNERVVLVRVPVRGGTRGIGPLRLDHTLAGPPATARRLIYVLGDKVYKGTNYAPVRAPVANAPEELKVETNFDSGTREAVSAVKFRRMTTEADVVHLLCHGVAEGGRGLYLEIEAKPSGHLSPEKVRALTFSRKPLVFVNACSSASATFSLTGLTTFGWSFLQAGAGAFIGALAPVTTDLALRFAKAFFEVYLADPGAIAEAVFAARQEVAGGVDPTWILYTLYADLPSVAPTAAA